MRPSFAPIPWPPFPLKLLSLRPSSPYNLQKSDSEGNPGYEVIEELTDQLLNASGTAFTNQQVFKLLWLIEKLHPMDRNTFQQLKQQEIKVYGQRAQSTTSTATVEQTKR